MAQVASGYITQPLGEVLGGSLRPYAKGIAMFGAAVVMDAMKIGGAKSKLLAAGAAGAAGAEVAAATVGPMLSDSGIYTAEPMPLAEYDVTSGFADYSNPYS